MNALQRFYVAYDGNVIFSTPNAWEAVGAFQGIVEFAKASGLSTEYARESKPFEEIDRCMIDNHVVTIKARYLDAEGL